MQQQSILIKTSKQEHCTMWEKGERRAEWFACSSFVPAPLISLLSRHNGDFPPYKLHSLCAEHWGGPGRLHSPAAVQIDA